ncbi:hypothetical protein VU11_02045 [Desulfobulbus sp. US2]|nr:hypothetical protein [Desulfobulbus sp. US2]
MVHLYAFFQVGLLTGYIYAHLLARYLSSRRQVFLHAVLLGASLFLLPITPDAALKPAGDDDPVWGIIRLLLLTVGGPYVLISSTGPLLQHWYRLKYADRSPYRLYALSNLGSLLGLISYPFLVEPNMILVGRLFFGPVATWPLPPLASGVPARSCRQRILFVASLHPRELKQFLRQIDARHNPCSGWGFRPAGQWCSWRSRAKSPKMFP